jgi:hypothetical protein
MKNFESQTAKILLEKIQDITAKQEQTTAKNLSHLYLTQISILCDLARELFNISTTGWHYIEIELAIIAYPETCDILL